MPLTENSSAVVNNQSANQIIANLRPIDVTAKTLQITPTADSTEKKVEMRETSLKAAVEPVLPIVPLAQLKFLTGLPEMNFRF